MVMSAGTQNTPPGLLNYVGLTLGTHTYLWPPEHMQTLPDSPAQVLGKAALSARENLTISTMFDPRDYTGMLPQ